MSETKKIDNLFKNRNNVEGSVLFSLFQECSLFDDYPLTEKDFKTPDGKLLYQLGRLINDKGTLDYIDKVSIDLELANNADLKNQIDEYGGSKSIIKQMNVVNKQNIENYYDELMKSNYLMSLHGMGFDVFKYSDKFNKMNLEQVKDFMEYKFLELDGQTSRVGKGLEINELYIDDELFDEMLSGDLVQTVSFGLYSPKLNDILFGLPLGMTTIVSAPSGTGKSTYIFSNMVYPAIKQGEIVTLISNELKYKQYLIMLMVMVLSREFEYYGVTRDKILKSHLTEQDRVMLVKAKDFINTNYKNAIYFINYKNNDIKNVIRTMKKYSKIGSRVVVFDTMKAGDSANERAWGQLTEDSKALDFACQETNQSLVVSYQIAMYASEKRRLSGADLSQGKQVKEVATNHVILRKLHSDEFSGKKYDIKPYYWKHNPVTGKTEKVDIKITDEESRYIVAFVEKSRNGKDDVYILYKFNGAWATYTELGYCNPVPDGKY